jgi:TatD DNase family protein
MLVDTHCHLDFPEFEQDRAEVIQRARSGGIDYFINIGSSLSGSEKSCLLAQEYDCIYATAGIHPHEADAADEKIIKSLTSLAKKNKIVAIGEIGLDYYKNYSKHESQLSLFISLVKLAKDLNLPLVIHSRQAEADTLKVLKSYLPLNAVLHCFSGDLAFLKECLDLGFFISFTCNVTYKKAQGLRNLVKATPLDRVMLETDAPFLSPEGYRGRRNEPLYIKMLAEEVSRIKGLSLEDVAKATTDNAKLFFRLK